MKDVKPLFLVFNDLSYKRERWWRWRIRKKGEEGEEGKGARGPPVPGGPDFPRFSLYISMFCVGRLFFLSFQYLMEFWVANEAEYRFWILSISCTQEQCCFFGDHWLRVECVDFPFVMWKPCFLWLFLVMRYLIEFWVPNEDPCISGILSMSCTQDRCYFFGDRWFRVESINFPFLMWESMFFFGYFWWSNIWSFGFLMNTSLDLDSPWWVVLKTKVVFSKIIDLRVE